MRAICGATMARGDVCVRTPDHRYEHRSAYALDNARRARHPGRSDRVPYGDGVARVQLRDRYTASPAPVLGPCRCLGCGEPVYWAERMTRRLGLPAMRFGWREEDGSGHRCPNAWAEAYIEALAKQAIRERDASV